MKVMMIGSVEKSGGVSTHTKAIMKEFVKLGISVDFYNLSPNREYSSLLDNLVKLYKKTFGISIKLLRHARNYDIVHIQGSGPLGGFIPAMACAFWRSIIGMKLVFTFHHSQTELFLKRYEKIFRYVLNRTDRLIVVSKAQKRLILSKYGLQFRDKLEIIPNGFDPSVFKRIPLEKARSRLGLDMNDKILLNIAALMDKKGQKYLIDAIKIIVTEKNYHGIKCIIIGNGPLYQNLKSYIKFSCLDDIVDLTGWVSLEKVILYLNAADIFVLPSIYESFGIVQLEAMACGKPIVATRNGGSEEIIISNEYGFLAYPGNSYDLAEKIKDALDNSWDENNILNYVNKFSWENIASRIFHLYNILLRD